jgi:hypothetical protein
VTHGAQILAAREPVHGTHHKIGLHDRGIIIARK